MVNTNIVTKRKAKFLICHLDKIINCFDGGPGLNDRYTVVFISTRHQSLVNTYVYDIPIPTETTFYEAMMIGDNCIKDAIPYYHTDTICLTKKLGKKIKYKDLPKEVKNAVMVELKVRNYL